jgi:LysM repeat protein
VIFVKSMEMRKWIWILAGLMIQIALSGQRSREMSREDYITTYASLAMREMSRVGIPASITLAQGCLESNNGNSRLAVAANNHFGIKCHEWEGRKIYHDDDHRNECFRVYTSAYESYLDHSMFLSSKERYASLFNLDNDDYKGWAHGLKKAGYATARNYASMLIGIIEDNELYRYDKLVLSGKFAEEDMANLPSGYASAANASRESRGISVNNNVEYVRVEAGDTPESLRDELDLYKNELYRYNELEKDAGLEPGQIIYLQPKRRKAASGNEIHVVEKGETMYQISQIYGVKLKSLYKYNQLVEGEEVPAGTTIYLRHKPKIPVLKSEPPEKEEEGEVMQFQFDE